MLYIADATVSNTAVINIINSCYIIIREGANLSDMLYFKSTDDQDTVEVSTWNK